PCVCPPRILHDVSQVRGIEVLNHVNAFNSFRVAPIVPGVVHHVCPHRSCDLPGQGSRVLGPLSKICVHRFLSQKAPVGQHGGDLSGLKLIVPNSQGRHCISEDFRAHLSRALILSPRPLGVFWSRCRSPLSPKQCTSIQDLRCTQTGF